MITDDFAKNLSADSAAVLMDVKEVCIKDATLTLISSKAMVNTTDITEERQSRRICNRMMEPVSGFVICVNALCIGIQLDVANDWPG
eukprot:CAMPEP_0172843162 /NCGR_PEP_ID=MMETSP1075-20121228/31258_1 /TAXON_ID=2916 /ORGANISM="Ceratium fusus, Strain PA161109" /LENGTH=86 /DNA_ID=CAMNT_0013687389 /DNA_START=42 /DNA_END=298 /DNA_ORIENTATION=+